MYYYIYDSFLNNKKYITILNRIETRLMDLGINGRTEKLTILKSFKEVVREAIKKGASTIVAVGNDDTVSKIISFLPNLSIILGIIPIGPNNKIAKLLGVPESESACDTLSARIIEKLDLGKANDSYFINSLAIPAQKELIMDYGNYHVSPLFEKGYVNIYNLNNALEEKSGKKNYLFNPKDGILEAVFSSSSKNHGILSIFKKKYSQDSIFPFKKLKIKYSKECLPVVADGQTTIKTPVTVEVAPKKLKVIVGKNRMF